MVRADKILKLLTEIKQSFSVCPLYQKQFSPTFSQSSLSPCSLWTCKIITSFYRP